MAENDLQKAVPAEDGAQYAGQTRDQVSQMDVAKWAAQGHLTPEQLAILNHPDPRLPIATASDRRPNATSTFKSSVDTASHDKEV